MWRRAQDEAHHAIKTEQDCLDCFFAAKIESLCQAEDHLAQKCAHRLSNGPDYYKHLLMGEELHVHQEQERINKLCTDNPEWLSHLIKQETDHIHAAMIKDELTGHLTPEESKWLECNIECRNAKEQCLSQKKEAEEVECMQQAQKLEKEEQATKLWAAQAEELTKAACLEHFTLPPIPDT